MRELQSKLLATQLRQSALIIVDISSAIELLFGRQQKRQVLAMKLAEFVCSSRREYPLLITNAKILKVMTN